MRVSKALAATARRAQTVAITVRGKILLAFFAVSTITGCLGAYAVASVGEAGKLVVATYDKPLMSTSYARLALSSFTSGELAMAQRQATTDPDKARKLDARMDELSHTVSEALAVAEERASSIRAAAAAHDIARLIARYNELRQLLLAHPVGAIQQSKSDASAAAIIEAFDGLVELTAEDGFKDRARALASIERYRLLTLLATAGAFLLSALIAGFLAHRMVRPIAVASRAARRIAAGELDVMIESNGGDELGELLSSMATMRDNIRAMVDREIAARRSAQSRLANALETCSEGVAFVDGQGRIITANSQMCAFFPDLNCDPSAETSLSEALEEAFGSPAGEICLPDRRWIRVKRSGETEDGYVVFAGDITPLKERETALLLAKEQAEAADKAKTSFLATMSHELRTPLNAVIGFSEIIANELFGPVGTPRYREFAADVVSSARHLLQMINDILDIVKLQSGKTELVIGVVQVEEVIVESLTIIQAQAEKSEIVIRKEIEAGLPPIRADQVRLRQILLNLLSNALKFTPCGGDVCVSVQVCGSEMIFAVRDTGIGIALSDIPKALEPFAQIDSSLSRKYDGTGLGLPLTKRFAELHGGHLAIESAPGEGTTVTVTLPLVEGAPASLARAV